MSSKNPKLITKLRELACKFGGYSAEQYNRSTVVWLSDFLWKKCGLFEPICKELAIPEQAVLVDFCNGVINRHCAAIKQHKRNNKKYNRRNMKLDQSKHYFFVGDNLSILGSIEAEGYFDICYIDPPYNTRKKMGKYSDNFSSHEAWVEFMRPRLELVVPMLKKSGLIFISIGAEELAYLTMLCDKVFGEKNFVSIITWQSKYTVANDKTGISSQTEYIVVYAKDEEYMSINKDPLRPEYVDKTYKNPDNDPRGPWRGGVQLFKKKNKNLFTVKSPTGISWTKAWNYNQETWKSKLEKENLIWWGENGDKCPVKKVFLKDSLKTGRGVINLWLGEEVGYTSTGTADLTAFVGDNRDFLYPKPVKLIKRILQIAGDKDCKMLDFFAGSGTTGQAVLEMNKADGGNRQFVLITNNENNIANEITKPRLEKVIKGYVHAKAGNAVEGTGGELEIIDGNK